MKIFGRELHNIDEMKRYFEIDELIYSYANGELDIWLERIGECHKAEQVRQIPKNAFLLIQLYQILGFDPEMTEDEIRRSCI